MPSALKAITSFQFAGLTPTVTGVVNEVTHTVALTVPYGVPVTAFVPTITISALASIAPTSGTAGDFTSPIVYMVMAEDASTQQYTVTVITSLTLLKQYLQLAENDVSRDSLLQSMWDDALITIENELNYEVTNHAVTYQIVGNTIIPFPEPVYSGLMVKYRNDLTDTDGTYDTTLTPWIDYYVYPRHIELLTSRCSDPRIILTYVGGWPTLPATIENAQECLWHINFNWLRQHSLEHSSTSAYLLM